MKASLMGLAESQQAATVAFERWAQVLEEWRRDFEASLSVRERARYDALLKDHPELGWLDIARRVRP